MDIGMEKILPWFVLGNILISWASIVFNNRANKDKATTQSIKAVSDELGEKIEEIKTSVQEKNEVLKNVVQEQLTSIRQEFNNKYGALAERVSKLEGGQAKSPTHDDLSKVHASINLLAATVNQLVGEGRNQSESLKMILHRIAEKGL